MKHLLNADTLLRAEVILPAAIICGFVFPQLAVFLQLKSWMLYLLALITFLSVRNLNISRPKTHEWHVTGWLLLTNYIFLTGSYLILGYFFITDETMRHAIWMIGIMPPAVSIISFTVLMKGNLRETMFAETIGFLMSLVIAPLLAILLFGEHLNLWAFFKTFLIVFIIPVALGLAFKKVEDSMKWDFSWIKRFIALGNSLYFYALIAVNRDLILSSGWGILLPIAAVMIIAKFVFVGLLYWSVKSSLPHSELVDLVLFGSFKMIGMAASLSVAIWGAVAGLPVAIDGVFFVIQLVALELIMKTKK